MQAYQPIVRYAAVAAGSLILSLVYQGMNDEAEIETDGGALAMQEYGAEYTFRYDLPISFGGGVSFIGAFDGLLAENPEALVPMPPTRTLTVRVTSIEKGVFDPVEDEDGFV